MTLAELDATLKSQKVRAFDVYALGPFMLWYAMKSKGMGSWPRRTLFVAGVMTIVYNWGNYRKVQESIAAKMKEQGGPWSL